MRNHPVTWLLFVLKLLAIAFLCAIAGGALYTCFYEPAPPPVRFLTGIYALSISFYLYMYGTWAFYDIRNMIRGLPMPTFFQAEVDHGDSIHEVKRGIRDATVEYLAVFTKMGFKLTEVTNFDPSSIYKSKKVETITKEHPGCIKLHNHPGTDDLPFSSADIYSAMADGESRTIVVTRDSVYEFILPRRYTKREAKRARKLFENKSGFTGNNRERRIYACELVAAEFGLTFKMSSWRD